MTAGSLLAALFALGWLALGVRGLRMRGAVPRLPAAEPLPDPPRLSIVVPARNEEGQIEACLRSLLAQDHPNLEIVVVDDGSTDRTGEILASLERESRGRLRVLRAGDPPPGWIGKNHACAVGASAARGEWILFTDADVRHDASVARRALARATSARLDFLSLAIRIEAPPFLGALFLPGLYLGVWLNFRPDRANDPRDPSAVGAGGFLLFRKAAYAAIGGHGAVRDHIVEDINLARLVKAKGFRTEFALGDEILRTTMYRSLAHAWEGTTKNAFAAVDFSLPRAIGGAVALSAAVLGPLVGLAVAALSGSAATPYWAAAALSETAVLAGIAAYARVSPFLLPLVPFGLALWSVALLASALRTRRGGVLWKGRRYYARGEGIPPDPLVGARRESGEP